MEPGRKIATHACEARIFSPTSAMRSPTVLRPLPLPFPGRLAISAPPLEAHPVGVAVVGVALVGVTFAWRGPGLAQNDDPSRAAVDAQGTAGADVLVDDEHDLVVRVETGLDRVHGLGHSVRGQHVDALPRT